MVFNKERVNYGQVLIYVACSILYLSCSNPNKSIVSLSNLAHLNRLYEEITIDGHEIAIVHIYSEYPDYGWVDAGDEGIACVDDAARAAVVYLRHFEFTGDTTSLQRGRKLIDFCRFMQDDDGQFYNFIYSDYSINQKGKTSFKSLGWWAGRAILAMGEGYRVFIQQEPEYATLLGKHIQMTFSHIDTLLTNNANIDTVGGFLVPQWLLYNSASDATTELALGLASYARASNDERAIKYLERFASGMIAMQLSNPEEYLYGAFLSWKNIWHGWGNSQTQALAEISRVIQNHDFLNAAELEAQYFYPYWISQGWPREIELSRTDSLHAVRVDSFSQIAYALRPMIVGSLRLFEITGKEEYAELAGELSTWFFGANPAQAEMYDPKTGRCFDGILSSKEINRNAGAESTIEALYSILEVENNPIAFKKLKGYLDLRDN
ncbi:hypothetical protein IIC38_12630 [candidate division KSB1 bacterium]|nr:hypothetical protein [candidate division KSB1 bacterium]